MSLPPNAVRGGPPAFANVSPAQQDKMDAPLIALTQQSGGDLRKLLYLFFSFLHRRTDFYCVPNERDIKEGVPTRMGFREGDAEKLLLAAFRQFPLRRMPRQKTESSAATKEPMGKEAAAPAKPNEMADSQSPCEPASEKTRDAEGTKFAATSVAPNKARASVSATITDSKSKDPKRNIRRTDEGKQIPVGNGGTAERYCWTQTIDEISVVVPIPDGTRGRDLDVLIRPSHISVRKTKDGDDETPILKGDLMEKIRPDESTWSLEGGALLLTLDKVKKTWWETVLEGDDKIDTTLVDSSRNIGEYDEETQGAIRKIMFDQKQERLGLPSSNEILGKKSVPPLPGGVEYIDQSTLDGDGGREMAGPGSVTSAKR